MNTPDIRSRNTVVLLDTNVIIESVRIGCWNALSGSLRIETVEECREETRRGSPHNPGYVTVSESDLARIAKVHPVTALERAGLALRYADALSLDPGERDLLAHALTRISQGDNVWVVCSPDLAAVRAAFALDWIDRTHSLEALLEATGSRPAVPMKDHFRKKWLSDFRTRLLLGRG